MSGEAEYTDDGGRVLPLGWVEYFDATSGHNFYVHDGRGETVWDYPEELWALHHEQQAAAEAAEAVAAAQVLAIEGVPEDGSSLPGGALAPSAGGPLALRDQGRGDTPQSSRQNSARGSAQNSARGSSQLAAYGEPASALAVAAEEEAQSETDEESDEELDARAKRLGGGFRAIERNKSESDQEEEELVDPRYGAVSKTLGGSTAAMLEKLSNTRAAQQGDVMENQAAFSKKGMLMLESIETKGDPNDEAKPDDEELIAKLAGERVKMQEEAEKVRLYFTDSELFSLREEFNNVDADRSGYIDDDELKVLLTILNDSKVPTESEVRRIMLSADSSGDGQLDFLEFLAMVKGMREEKKKNKSIFKSIGQFADTIKNDVLAGVGADLKEYKTRAHRFLNKEAVERAERREAEKKRIAAEKEAERLQLERDAQQLLAEEEAARKAIAERDEPTGLDTTILYQGNEVDYPEEDDFVTVHIKMMFSTDPDNPNPRPKPGSSSQLEVLENSRRRKRPFKFLVNGGAVIPGLALCLPKMSLGTKMRVVVPPELAYGHKGLPPKVPPDTTLILEIELLSFDTQDNAE